MILISVLLALGSIEGVVHLEGARPPPAKVAVTIDQKYCGTEQPDESVLVSPEGGLRNVIVSLRTAPPEPAPAAAAAQNAPNAPTAPPALPEVTLDQKGCAYAPHVQAAQLGSKLVVVNQDPVLHNAHANRGALTAFNFAFPMMGAKRQAALDQPGVLRLSCQAGHSWMSGFIAVFPHRFFAVTDEHGRFRLDGVPPGEHELELWHEPPGGKGEPVVRTVKVKVKDGQATKALASLRL